MRISVGICAYNEEANIGRLLKILQKEPGIYEVIVVASGCTDNTVKIAKQYDVKLIEQTKREGKASAVNAIIEKARGNIIVLEGADTLPSAMCFQHLLAPFKAKHIGVVGAHPIPVNEYDMMGRLGHLLWHTHHLIACHRPKAGEVIAFRNIIKGIDYKTPVDEASIEKELSLLGYRVAYAPKAIVFNRAPMSIRDFINQRARIYQGHLMLKAQGYEVPTMDKLTVLKQSLKATNNDYVACGIGMALEYYSRSLAMKRYKYNGYDAGVWDMIKTTKEL